MNPIAELCPRRGEPAWYCLRTHLKHEHIVSAHLRKLYGVEVFNPQLRLFRSTRRGRRLFVESLFPSYVFARFVLESMLDRVTYTPAVKCVLRFGDRVPEIPGAEIEELQQGLAGLSASVLTDTPASGEEVEVVTGPFAGSKATIVRVHPGKERVRILLEILGQSVPAELSLETVLRHRRDAAQLALRRADSDRGGRSRTPITALATSAPAAEPWN